MSLNWHRPVLSGLVTGALGTIPLGRAPFPVKAALAVFPAGMTAAVVGAELRHRAGADAPAWRGPVIGAGLGAAMAGAGAASFALDRGAELFLIRLGVRRPRLTLGIAAGVLYTVLDLADAAAEARAEEDERAAETGRADGDGAADRDAAGDSSASRPADADGR